MGDSLRLATGAPRGAVEAFAKDALRVPHALLIGRFGQHRLERSREAAPQLVQAHLAIGKRVQRGIEDGERRTGTEAHAEEVHDGRERHDGGRAHRTHREGGRFRGKVDDHVGAPIRQDAVGQRLRARAADGPVTLDPGSQRRAWPPFTVFERHGDQRLSPHSAGDDHSAQTSPAIAAAHAARATKKNAGATMSRNCTSSASPISCVAAAYMPSGKTAAQ